MKVRQQHESRAQATALVLQSGEFGELERRTTGVLASAGASARTDAGVIVAIGARAGVASHPSGVIVSANPPAHRRQ